MGTKKRSTLKWKSCRAKPAIGSALRYLLVGVVLVVELSVLASCVVVMNRKFEAEHKFYPVDSVWNVGVPYVEALGHTSDRSIWNSQTFEVYIPFSSTSERWPFDELRESVASGSLRIDSVHITLPGSGARIARAILVRMEPAADSGQLIVGGLQSYVDDYVPILISDTLTIPVEEDSIWLAFDLKTLDKATGVSAEKHFDFTLYRAEGKKLALDSR